MREKPLVILLIMFLRSLSFYRVVHFVVIVLFYLFSSHGSFFITFVSHFLCSFLIISSWSVSAFELSYLSSFPSRPFSFLFASVVSFSRSRYCLLVYSTCFRYSYYSPLFLSSILIAVVSTFPFLLATVFFSVLLLSVFLFLLIFYRLF